MAWTGFQLIMAVVMVITGSINTLGVKWADGLQAKSRDGEFREFDHPFFQSTCMFLGESLCFVMFKIFYVIYSRRNDGSVDVKEMTKGNRNFNPFVLFIPAMCDMTSSSLTYIGLNLTYASSFQMLRGSVILFVGLLSVGFLDRVLKKREWFGIALIMLGLAVVGTADFIGKDTNLENYGRNAIITGDLLIILAQIITAAQMVVEEKYVAGLDIPPMQAAGWEGIFGFLAMGSLLIPFYYIEVGPPFSNNPRGVLEDALDAFVQIGNCHRLIFIILGTIISLAFFNFTGIGIIKDISATACIVLDSVRVIVIWAVGLLFMGEQFHWLQLVGFILMLVGMCIYNGITFTTELLKIRAVLSNLRYKKLDENVVENGRTNQTA